MKRKIEKYFGFLLGGSLNLVSHVHININSSFVLSKDGANFYYEI